MCDPLLTFHDVTDLVAVKPFKSVRLNPWVPWFVVLVRTGNRNKKNKAIRHVSHWDNFPESGPTWHRRAVGKSVTEPPPEPWLL